MQIRASAVQLWQGCLSVCLSRVWAVSNWLNIIVKYVTTTPGSLTEAELEFYNGVVFPNLWQTGAHKES